MTAGTTILYVLRGRRLAPLIAFHWASDAATARLAASTGRADLAPVRSTQQGTGH